MSGFRLFAAFFGLSCVAAPLAAAELATIDRSIAKEPAYQSKPNYCLLAFGADAASRVWLVEDTGVLYVDRNGNGDLTEAGERVEAQEKKESGSEFDAGDLFAGDRVHKHLRVSVANPAARAAGDPMAKQHDPKNSGAPRYSFLLEVDMPGRTGLGIDGRVEQVAGHDTNGFLEFAADPKHAPIVNFDGPWQVTLFDSQRLIAGRSTAMYLAVGTPGIGLGSTAYVAYENVIPEGIHPRVEIIFPPQHRGEPAIKEQYGLKCRCCTVNFHDLIAVPDSVGGGEAEVALSFDSAPGVEIGPSQHKIEIIRQSRGFELEPVSPRLKRALVHPDRKGYLTGLSYSPDGKRIVAGNVPEASRNGVIQVWDAETGKELTKLLLDPEDVPSDDYFKLTPDWNTALVALRGKRSYARVEKDGKPLMRWEFGGSVQAWDLASGKLQKSFKHSPPRQILSMEVAPDGKTLLTSEVLPGEAAMQPPRGATLWDIDSGKSRELSGEFATMIAYSPDSKLLAAATINEKRISAAVKLIDVATFQERLSISIAQNNAQCGDLTFSPDGKTLVGQLYGNQGEHWLKFWDAPRARRRARSPARRTNSSFAKHFLLIRSSWSPPQAAKASRRS